MIMMDDLPKHKGKHRNKVESEMIRRREKEFKHQQMWTGAENYYQHFGKVNTRYQCWTSPRYYEDNNKLISEVREKRNKEELLEKRKEKLRKLLEEEHRSYEIEMTVHKNLGLRTKPKEDNVPTEVLKDVNVELKQKEEEKRRAEAELKLYHQWRTNNPIVRQYESKYRFKDLKLSWLDQQIEKRMQKEEEEREHKRLLKEQEERIKREREKDEHFKKTIEERKTALRECLDAQIRELKDRQILSEDLKKQEQEETKRKIQLDELEQHEKEEEKRRACRECALYNIKQYKLKLKHKAADIQQNLSQEREFLSKIKNLQLEDLIQDEVKKNEVKEGLKEFLYIVKEQQELEKQRQKHLEFIFDSEAKSIYERQLEMWRKEEAARKRLVKDVLEVVKKQVEDNLERNKERQKEVLLEREEMAAKIEEYDKELRSLKEQEEEKAKNRKKVLDEELKLKKMRKKQEENTKLKEIDEELERVRKEEERLQKEILEIQRRQGPCKPQRRSRIFY